MQNIQGDESKGYPARRSLFTGNNELCTEDNRSSDIELESTMVESVENYPNIRRISLKSCWRILCCLILSYLLISCLAVNV